MTMYEIIQAKRSGRALTREQISFFVRGFTAGDIPDYQAAALLMAICLRGMTARETADLTLAMAASGDRLDLSSLPGVPVDKHSTGGVGDKTTLIVAPAAAACGVPVCKMSGRGLGHTGGTIDKLEAIPGFRTSLTPRQAIVQTRRIGLCVAGQTGRLAPADKKMYALRDVTATVQSLPLIASSIMSKKIAAGCRGIVLDVKFGSGAFMKTRREAEQLALQMLRIGKRAGRRCAAVLSDMDRPLGYAVGNAVEVAEAVEVLRGGGPADLRALCVTLAGLMVGLSLGLPREQAEQRVTAALADGSALEKLRQLCAAQGGDVRCIDDPSRLPQAACRIEVPAPQSGYLLAVDTEQIGLAAMLLGAGRRTRGDAIDPAAGILLRKKPGNAVQKGEPLAVLLTDRPDAAAEAAAKLTGALRFGAAPPTAAPLIAAVLTEA
ncbi:MAG: thymidine phosphorylase [Clostridia bacterium]|nr:thymidine phosphorylase [Clostridia bacterium]